MSRGLIQEPGGGEHGALLDLLQRRGYRVHARDGGTYEVLKAGKKKIQCRGTAAEIHRWFRSIQS
jgi:hypothetical protein